MIYHLINRGEIIMTTEERINIAKSLFQKSTMVDCLAAAGYFTAPASISHHGSYDGALFDHSYMVTKTLLDMTDRLNLEWERMESPIIVGMLHDICKIDSYAKISEATGAYEYKWNKNQIITGHGDKSCIIAQKYICMTEEEIACIRYHMGAFTAKEEWTAYTNAIHKYPNVLYTHTADMIAAHIIGV
jgi:HD superfamily phosphohydrolase YqeK